MLEQIKNLYRKYIDDLEQARNYIIREYNNPRKDWWWQSDDIEAEITYLRLRESNPETVVEISPCRGASSLYILLALRDNNKGFLHSYDVHDFAKYNVPLELTDRWALHIGDAKEAIIPKMDYLFLDSDHTLEFANWYIENLLEKYSNIPVSVHDVFHVADPNGFSLEGGRIIEWLDTNNIEWFTVSANKNPEGYNEIKELKKVLGIADDIHPSQNNPTVFFNL